MRTFQVTLSMRPAIIAGLVWAAFLVAVAILGAGCVCQPGGRITVNVGYRSAQGCATNIVNQVEGGGTLTPKVAP
jgi:hypothetical protein